MIKLYKMKTYNILTASALLMLGMLAVSCENGDIDFPDYEKGVTVYFPTQNPVRTLVMGEDEYDVTLDNAHKCKIGATMGGAYNGRNINIEVAVDNSLCNNLYFSDGETPVLPMPSNYYTLGSNTIKFNGDVKGYVDVQFTDAFFNDPKALTNNYVIPLLMKSQTGADSILSGKAMVAGETPQLTNAPYWDVQPKNYVLYLVKYICKYDAKYIRRGIDEIKTGGSTYKNVRHAGRLDKDEIFTGITTLSLNSIKYPVTYTVNKKNYNCDLILSFDDKDNCTIKSGTNGVKVSGTGAYKVKSEKKAWGNKDRDAMYLDYKVEFSDASFSTRDTLIWQRRGVKSQEFATVYKQK